MERIKTVLAGLGRIGWQFHLPSILKHEGFRLTGVCDMVEERLQEAQELCGANGYTDFAAMLAAESPKLVVIATPTHLHAEQAIYAMEHGCDVFIDKPVALNLEETDKMLDAMRRTGRKLMVYQPQRGGAAAQTLRGILQSGIIGDVFLMKKSRSDFVHRDDWQAFRKYGGGMLNNYGAHLIDEMLYIAGAPAEKVNGHMNRIASAGDADDFVKLLIQTQNGIMLDIEINMATAFDLPETMVYGACGTIRRIDTEDGSAFHIRYFDPQEQTETVASDVLAAANRKYVTASPQNWREKTVPIKAEAAVDFYEKCYDYFALGQEPYVPAAETREVMRVMQECRKDAGWL